MFKNRNLPKDATPWGREVEERVETLESALNILKSSNASNISQLQSTFNNTASIWNNFNNIYSRTGKNIIINGAMDIWQRGTSSTAAGYCCADRWFLYASAGTLTGTQESVIIPTGFSYALRLSSSSASVVGIRQIIENQNAVCFGGKTVTVSAYVASGSVPEDFNIILKSSPVINALSTDTSWTELNITAFNGSVVTANSYSRIYATFNVPENCETLMLSIEASVNASANIYITGVQIELGSTATDFTRTGGTVYGELSNCQRYYYRHTPVDTAGTVLSVSVAGASASAMPVFFPVPMRIAPTSLDVNPTLTGNYIIQTATATTPTSATFQPTRTSTFCGSVLWAHPALTGGAAIELRGMSSSGYIGFSAEML